MTSPSKSVIFSSTDHESAKDVSELAEPEVGRAHTPDQEFAKELVRQQAAQANKLLIRRSKVVLVIVVLALVTLAGTLFTLLPPLWDKSHEAIGVGAVVALFNILIQSCTAGYFARARDPDTAQGILRLFLLLNSLELVAGFLSYGSVFLTAGNIILLVIAYMRMPALRYGTE